MGKLDSLKIDNSPLAFASFAAKHNALVDLLAGMVGENGISVVMAERNAIIRGNIANTGGSGSLPYEDANVLITVDGNGIKLLNKSSNDYAKIYPTGAIGIYDSSSGNEMLISPSDMFYGDFIPREFTICNSGSPANVRLLASDLF